MKQLLIWAAACTILISCNDNSFEKIENKPQEHKLSFVIESVYYSNPTTDTTSITCKLNTDKGLISREETNYNFISGDLSSSPDSIYLKNSLTFLMESQDAFIYGAFEISFSYMEALNNLNKVTDSTYNYNDLSFLYTALENREWDSELFDQDYTKNQFSFTIPESASENWHNENIQSNGFIIDYEHMDLTDVLYDEKSGELEIAGEFEVSLKVYSCGYYEFYRIKEGTFTAMIQP